MPMNLTNGSLFTKECLRKESPNLPTISKFKDSSRDHTLKWFDFTKRVARVFCTFTLMNIAANLLALKKEIPSNVTLVAVSKTKPNEAIQEAYDSGHRVFGENKVQEMVQKHDQLPKDIEWHMIGHLQRNKVKYMASFVSLIHGVDTEKLLVEINKQAHKHNRIIDCLLQIHIAEETTKFGFDPAALEDIMVKQHEFPCVRIKGVMGMATFTQDEKQIKREFRYLKNLFSEYFDSSEEAILSIGMSGDYPIAIAEGSTMIRVGSLIFGARE